MKIFSGVKNINLVEGIPFFVVWSEDEQGLYSYTFHYENPIDGQWEEFLDVEETSLFLEAYVEKTKAWILTNFESTLRGTLEDIRVVRKIMDEFIQAAEKVMVVNGL